MIDDKVLYSTNDSFHSHNSDESTKDHLAISSPQLSESSAAREDLESKDRSYEPASKTK